METQWGMSDKERNIAEFTDSLAQEIDTALTKKGCVVEVKTYALEHNTGFIIHFDHYHSHHSEVMVSSNREKDGYLSISRSWRIRPSGVSTGGRTSTPEELRGTAQTYEEMANFLNERFGEPVSEHDGRSIHITKLEKKLVA